MILYLLFMTMLCFFSSTICASEKRIQPITVSGKDLGIPNLSHTITIAALHKACLDCPNYLSSENLHRKFTVPVFKVEGTAEFTEQQNEYFDFFAHENISNFLEDFLQNSNAIPVQPILPSKDQNDDDTPSVKKSDTQRARDAFVAASNQRTVNPHYLKRLIQTIPSEELNTFDQTGQTLSHKLTPIHWIKELIPLVVSLGVDVTKATTDLDRFPNSTLAHNLAGLLLSRSSKKYLLNDYNTKTLDCLFEIWKVDKGEHFNQRAIAQSQNTLSVWNLLERSDYLYEFLDRLENEFTHLPPNYILKYQRYVASKR